MTIEAIDSAIYVRCGSGDGDVIEFDRAQGDDMIRMSLWFDVTSPIGSFVDEEYGEEIGGIPFISLHPAEALALGHMLVDMAQRQMLSETRPRMWPINSPPIIIPDGGSGV